MYTIWKFEIVFHKLNEENWKKLCLNKLFPYDYCFHCRFADKFEMNSTMYRELVKAYGIRFVISVTGEAGRFSFMPLLLTLGSGIGLLSVATVVADLFMLNFLERRQFYKDIKELNYRDEVGGLEIKERV